MQVQSKTNNKAVQKRNRSNGGFAAIVGVLTLVFTLFISSNAEAQLLGKGAVTGTVTDSSGAVVSGADVAVRNVSTGVLRRYRSSK
jgi:hypothetical protein